MLVLRGKDMRQNRFLKLSGGLGGLPVRAKQFVDRTGMDGPLVAEVISPVHDRRMG
jgi:hypothetical protein